MSRPAYRLVRVQPDHKDLAWLDSECFPEDAPVDTAGTTWWVVRLTGVGPVAFAGIRYWPADDCGYLCRAGVIPGHRGHGLQRRLIRARLRYAAKQGWSACYTYTVPDNLASANSLIRAGFKLWRPIRPWGGKSALYWWRSCKPGQPARGVSQ